MGRQGEGDRAAQPASAWMMLLLTLAYALNLLDRQVINIVAEPIKRELHLADWQLGALTGLSFAALYSVAALPIARAADRGDRVRIVGAAILAWSLFTAACGAAVNFLTLLSLRIGVGFGEAGCAPAAQSLIADSHAPQKRSGALAIFSLGSPLGAAVGLMAGGVLVGELGWRGTMLAAGAPGLLVGALILTTLRDSGRSEPRTAPLARTFDEVRRLLTRPSFVLIALGGGLLSFANYGAMAFAGSFYLRLHGPELAALGAPHGLKPLGVIGLALGGVGALGGGLGAYAGGRLGDRLGARDVRWLAWISATGSALGATGYLFMFLAPTGRASLLLFLWPAFAVNLWNGPGMLAMLSVAGERARAAAGALVILINSLVGLGLGPLSMGLLSDALAPHLGAPRGLQMAIVAGTCVGFLSAACHAAGARTLRQDVERTTAAA